MKKIMAIIVSMLIGLAGILDGYWLFFSNDSSQSASSSTSSSSATVLNTSTSTGTSTTSTTYKDGTYTGDSISTRWGNVQLQVTISNGKITDVKALAYPNSESKSIQINEQVIPTYTKETISAQSADIQAVSGATVTYDGYTKSLQSALDQAV